MSEATERSFEQALEEFRPLSESEQKDFVSRVRRIFRRRGTGGFEHTERPAALELFSGASAHRAIHSFEHIGTGIIDIVVETQGLYVEQVHRLASEEGGGILPHNDREEDAPAKLSRGDIALFQEFADHPDRFKEYDLKHGPSWEQLER